MKPLDGLDCPPAELGSPLAELLRSGRPDAVRAELDELDAAELSGAAAAARAYAHGALALREGRLVEARDAFDGAASDFESCGEKEAAALSRCEGWLACIRLGPRKIYGDAIDALAEIAATHEEQTVRVVADHYRGTALRYSGNAEETLGVLLGAFAASDGLLSERAQVLNSLGTLYVVMGAFGAARAVLEHAAELNHQIGDRVSEAISYGQLGSAAMARGELEAARAYLQKQEWFASRVGDAFGQARALVLLGDLAIDLERPDDAIAFAQQAREIASSVSPPLGMWIAYATRTIGRAMVELRDEGARAELDDARQRFEKMGNQLGEALVRWDLGRHALQAGEPGEREQFARSAWQLGGLGLTARVAQVLGDLRGGEDSDRVDRAIATAAQCYPHLSAAHEIELVYAHPHTLRALATARIEGQRNLGRLAALTIGEPGLHIAIVVSRALAEGVARTTPSRRAQSVLVGRMPGVVVWAWPAFVDCLTVARDIASLCASCADDARASLGWFAEARVHEPPFAGEVGAELRGAHLDELLGAAVAAAATELVRMQGVAWDGEAEALVRMSGLTSRDS